MLGAGLIHADLSAYNVLVWQGRPHVIDLPQAVDAAVHPLARDLLLRDVRNVTRHFARYGIPDDGQAIAESLWRRYERAEL
jgi:RIO kinase 1